MPVSLSSPRKIEDVAHGADLRAHDPGTEHDAEHPAENPRRLPVMRLHDVTYRYGVGVPFQPWRDEKTHQYLLQAEAPEGDDVGYPHKKHLFGVAHGKPAPDERSRERRENNQRAERPSGNREILESLHPPAGEHPDNQYRSEVDDDDESFHWLGK